MDSKFIIFEVAFIFLIIYALFNDKRSMWINKNRNLKIEVTRGEGSWNYLVIAFSIALSILFFIIKPAEIPYICKIIIGIIDFFLLIYLVFINGWFRNKIVGWANKIRNIKEVH